MRIETTSPSGQEFYIEQASDFNDKGEIVKGRGFFAGWIDGDCDLSGIFFETLDEAKAAIRDN